METKLEIGRSLYLIKNEYETIPTDVGFEFTERSPDSYYSDTVTDVDIDREKAIEIINFLKDAFSI